MIKYIRSLTTLLVLFLTIGYTQAQSPSAGEHAKRLFTGIWMDQKTTRYLEISFEGDHATIIDWTSKFQKKESGDIYKAFLKNGKLVMPEDTEHRAPYSEIVSDKGKLIYLTKPIGVEMKSKWDKQIFVRSGARP